MSRHSSVRLLVAALAATALWSLPLPAQGDRPRPPRAAAAAPAGEAVAAAPAAVAAPLTGVTSLADNGVRTRVVAALRRQSEERQTAALAAAAAAGIPTRGENFALVGWRQGVPEFVHTTNVNAAISTGADLIRNTAPYLANGAGWSVGVWDGGTPRLTHVELAGRVTNLDGSGLSDHATHVAGTIIASGVSASALGMAPAGSLQCYDFNSDTTEMTSRAQATPWDSGRLPLSNHSYVSTCGWIYAPLSGNSGYHWVGPWPGTQDPRFGQYDDKTAEWDALAFSAPYYLICKAAGNDRGENPSNGNTIYYYSGGWLSKNYNNATDPAGDGFYKAGYDTISGNGTAKNVLTIGAVNDAIAGGLRSLPGATMTTFSSWGPTDDGRIKPDVVGNGAGLTSSVSASDGAYGSMSGTSMATPNVTGSTLLVMDYFDNLFPNQRLRASTLKALLIHTADDLGTVGPDYQFGWGLLNVKAAADLLASYAANPGNRRVIEDFVQSAGRTSVSVPFTWDGVSPIRVTLCWTDPAATATSTADDPTLRLVNDLNLAVIGPTATTYSPFVLDPANVANAATTGVNTRDNVEQVLIAAPGNAGQYTANITFNGTLTGTAQPFSLIVSGGLTAVAASAPGLIGVSPNPVRASSLTTVQLQGANMLIGATAKLTRLGQPDLPATSLAVTPTLSAAAFNLSAAVNGFYNVVFTNPDGQSVTLYGGVNVEVPSPVYTFDLNTDPGWARTGEWAFGAPTGSGGVSYGNPDPASGATGANVFGVNLSGDYGIAIGGPFTLTSGAFNCTSLSAVQVHFQQWLNTDDAAYVPAFLDVSVNGGGVWTRVWTSSSGVAVTDNAWQAVSHDLSAVADHQADVRLRWGYQVLLADAYPYSGWNLDDISVWGAPPAGTPEIAVSGNGVNIVDGDATPSTTDFTDFGSRIPGGSTLTRTFTIQNTGPEPLALVGTPLVQVSGLAAADFTVTAQPTSPVASGGSTTFQVRFAPSVLGVRAAVITIANNDSDESPFDFAIQGTGVAPEIDVSGNGVSIADGDATPALADHTDFGLVVMGGATLTRTFTIQNPGTAGLALAGSPRVQVSGANAADFTVTVQPPALVAAGGSTTFQVQFTPGGLGARSAKLTIPNSDANEGTFDFAIQGTGIAPEIGVFGNGVSIADGDVTPSAADATDFGVVTLAIARTRTFTIQNTGVGPLDLTASPRVQVSGAAAADFTVTVQPATAVLSGGSTTFDVRFLPSDFGLRAAVLTIINSDANESTFDFAIAGIGTNVARDAINGDTEVGSGAAFGWSSFGTATASWATDATHGGTHSLKLVGNGSDSGWAGAEFVPPEPQPYTLTVGGWSRAAAVLGPSSYTLAFNVVLEDNTAVWYTTGLAFSTGTHAWEYRGTTVTFTKRVIRVQPYFLFYGGSGTVWLDDVSVKLQPTVSRNFMAEDPASVGGSTPAHWTTFGQTLTSTTGWATDQKKGGARSLKIVTTGGTNGGWINTAHDFAAPYPQRFTVRGWSRANNVAANASYMLNVYVVYEDNTTFWLASGLRFAAGTHDWQEVVKQISLPKGVKQVRAYCLLYGGTGTQTAWFDEVEVIPEAPRNANYCAEFGVPATGPTDWLTGNQTLTRATGWTTDAARSGTHALKVVNNAGSNAYWVNSAASFVEPYPRALVLGGSSKADAVAAAAVTYGLYFIVTFADDTTQGVSSGLTFAKGTHDWQAVETLARFAKGVKQVRAYALLYGGTGTQTAWFDDVYAIRYEPVDRNHHAEWGTPTMGPDYWGTAGQGLTKVTGWATDAVQSGQRALKVVNTTGSNALWAGTKVGFGSPYPRTFTLAGASRADNVAAAALYTLYFLVEFDDGTTQSYYGDYNAGTGRYSLYFTAGTHDWQTVEKRVTFAKNVKAITPYCLLYRGSGTQTAWFDDVYVIAE